MRTMQIIAATIVGAGIAAAGVVERGTLDIPAGATNATAIVSIGDAGRAYALDRVFLGTRASDYTGTVEVASLDWGYATSLATGTGITHAAPFEEYPSRSVVTTAYALDTNGVGTASTVTTNTVPYLVSHVQLYVTVNATNAATRRVFWAIYADE